MSDAVDGAPSDRARKLLCGAFDLQVHVGPGVIAHRIDDLSLARRFRELGLAGFALKSHHSRPRSVPRWCAPRCQRWRRSGPSR